MSRIDKELLRKNLNWRYATKRFDPKKKISNDDLETLLECTNLAPSSFGLQPFHFLVIENQELRNQLKAVSWNQTQIADCSHLVVVTTLKKVRPDHVSEFIDRIAKTRGMPRAELKGYEDAILGSAVNGPLAANIQAWTQRQAYISMGFLMETAALLEIDSCPMEGITPAEYDKILGLASGDYSAVSVVALGYRHAEDGYQHAKKVRKPSTEIFQFIR
jgi:nitroreductase